MFIEHDVPTFDPCGVACKNDRLSINIRPRWGHCHFLKVILDKTLSIIGILCVKLSVRSAFFPYKRCFFRFVSTLLSVNDSHYPPSGRPFRVNW
jgi:hypothetical protein